MRRPYDTAGFERVARTAREAVPGLALTTDVITGFPGETETELRESLAFVEAMAFARIHVFTYSERAGTRAASLPLAVPEGERRERTARMRSVASRSERAFRARQVGRTTEVLWEDRRAGCRRGTTDQYLRPTGPSAASSSCAWTGGATTPS
jgi:threonylcarbamoyladenosine tRNA methylthiotransferase MtaB